MNSDQNIDLGINIALGASLVVALSDSNRAIKDFLTSNFVVFILVLLYTFKDKTTDNILVSIALAFFAVVAVKLITMDDYQVLLENFELIYPGPSSSKNCLKVKEADLLAAFDGDSNKLKMNMEHSGVPRNLELNDVNAPEIATYLINNPNIKNIGDCKL